MKRKYIFYLALSLSILPISHWLQLTQVDGHGPAPGELDGVETAVSLGLVDYPHNDEVIVTELVIIKLGVEHSHSTLGSPEGDIDWWCWGAVEVTCPEPRAPECRGSTHWR